MYYDREAYESGEIDFKKLLDDKNTGVGITMCLASIQALCHGLSFISGWWTGVDHTNLYVRATKLALVHSEISEALEGARKDLNDDHLPNRKMEEVELADAIIRIFDYAETQGYNIGEAMLEKLRYNQSRADHKPENRQETGGKKI